jgi:hypothetical protein
MIEDKSGNCYSPISGIRDDNKDAGYIFNGRL